MFVESSGMNMDGKFLCPTSQYVDLNNLFSSRNTCSGFQRDAMLKDDSDCHTLHTFFHETVLCYIRVENLVQMLILCKTFIIQHLWNLHHNILVSTDFIQRPTHFFLSTSAFLTNSPVSICSFPLCISSFFRDL